MMNTRAVMEGAWLWRDMVIRGTGSRRITSISNTRKIKARRKKRRENGIRDRFFGSNPHSNGDDFSRSDWEREDKIIDAIRVMVAKIMAIEEE